jgi:hypothetical protein
MDAIAGEDFGIDKYFLRILALLSPTHFIHVGSGRNLKIEYPASELLNVQKVNPLVVELAYPLLKLLVSGERV